MEDHGTVSSSAAAERAEQRVPDPIRIVVVDESGIVREGLKAILGAEPDLQVVGVAGSADDLFGLVEQTNPDVVLLNPRLHAMSGLEACARLVERHRRLRVLIVSTHSDLDLVSACIAAGAHGYVIKDIERPQLIQAVRDLHRGEIVVSPGVAGRIIDQMRALVRVRTSLADWRSVNAMFAFRRSDDPRGLPPIPTFSRLTVREQDVLARLMNGERVPWIAADLFVSQSTVRNHLSSIFRKVGVHSQAELIRRLRPD
jgi:DNA-binding NarL/FixJ family response regulator